MVPIGIIGNFLSLIFNILYITILAEVILAYIPSLHESSFYRLLVSFNYPILEPFRRIQERFLGNMMIDLSPVFAIIFLNLISGFLIG